MASKRKAPSFEIPATVRGAGQAGWVYRTDAPRGKGRPKRASRAAAHTPVREAVTVVEPVTNPPDRTHGTLSGAEGRSPVPAAGVEPRVAAPSVAGRLVGLGLQVAAVPLVVPLFLTAAVARRLGTSGGQ